jgi:glycerophosphoryl diester phosphodiesterase
MPRIFAHRGGVGYFVENSLKAFEFALESGCDGAECDVHLTRDAEVIVHHNPRLNHHFARTPNGPWISKEDELCFEQLYLPEVQRDTIGEPNPQTHDSKNWPYLEAVAAQYIPTLRQVIETIKDRSTSFQLVIEIKSDIFNSQDDY